MYNTLTFAYVAAKSPVQYLNTTSTREFIFSVEVVDLDMAETAAGQLVHIRVENGTVKLGEANVVATDIEATNGIIHVIDRVIMPKM